MRKYLKWGVALLCANLALVSCDDDNDTLKDERNQKPLLTVTNVTTSGVEGDEVTFTVTSDRAISSPIDLKLELLDDQSTASFRDFVGPGAETEIADGGFGQGKIGYLFQFPAYATTATFTVMLEGDLLLEGTENIVLNLRSAGNGTGLIAPGSETLTIAVSDLVSNDIGISLAWAGNSYDTFGTLVEGDFVDYDFDIYVFDAATFDEVSGYQGATSASPEMVTLANADLADGDYLIIADLYDVGATPAVPVAIPASMTISKFGVWSKTIDLDYMTDHATSAPGGLAGGEMVVAVLTKTGTFYTLSTEGGEILASGRMSQLSNLVGKKRIK